MTRAAADALVAEGNELFRVERFVDAVTRFERAVEVFPEHALGWKGLGHALLCLGKPHDAARAFDRAIGLRPDSATALWGGAVAHAEVGNKLIAQNYLRRTLALQPTWIEMARGVAQLAPLLTTSNHAADLIRAALGVYSSRAYRHAGDRARALDVGRLADVPTIGQWTFVTIGMSNLAWKDEARPRIELLLATRVDAELCGQVLANLAFHLEQTGFYPEPGTMVRDVVAALDAGDLSRRLPHVYVMPPKLWPALSLPLDAGPPAITLAQVILISEAESQAWRRLGATKFERSLVERGVDVADLKRSGV